LNTTTRRNTIAGAAALAAPVTLPLLPVSAFAAPADPAVEAYRAWRAAHEAYERSLHPDVPDGCPVMLAACDADWRAKVVLASMIATTPAGLAGQLFMGLGRFGDLMWAGDDFDNPADYIFDGCRDDMDGRLYRNLLAGAEGMANA
jgi:hypothetical protein